MKALGLTGLILLVSFLPLTTANQEDCPPWSFPDTNSTRCICSSAKVDAIKCSKDSTLLSISHCMTYNSTSDEDTEVGLCPYVSKHTYLASDPSFFRLPNHTSNLTSFMCGSLHRRGLLCGECEDGFGPAIYSYTLECRKCWGHGFGWLLYITLAVVPSTILYIFVIIFHISAPSPPLSAFTFFCHITVYTVHLQSGFYFFFMSEIGRFPHVLLKVMLALSYSGIWNLDLSVP